MVTSLSALQPFALVNLNGETDSEGAAAGTSPPFHRQASPSATEAPRLQDFTGIAEVLADPEDSLRLQYLALPAQPIAQSFPKRGMTQFRCTLMHRISRVFCCCSHRSTLRED